MCIGQVVDVGGLLAGVERRERERESEREYAASCDVGGLLAGVAGHWGAPGSAGRLDCDRCNKEVHGARYILCIYVIHIHIHTHTHIHVYYIHMLDTYIYIGGYRWYINVYVYKCICTFGQLYSCICLKSQILDLLMYMYMYVCMCVCVCVCVCIYIYYIYIYIYTLTHISVKLCLYICLKSQKLDSNADIYMYNMYAGCLYV